MPPSSPDMEPSGCPFQGSGDPEDDDPEGPGCFHGSSEPEGPEGFQGSLDPDGPEGFHGSSEDPDGVGVCPDPGADDGDDPATLKDASMSSCLGMP